MISAGDGAKDTTNRRPQMKKLRNMGADLGGAVNIAHEAIERLAVIRVEAGHKAAARRMKWTRNWLNWGSTERFAQKRWTWNNTCGCVRRSGDVQMISPLAASR